MGLVLARIRLTFTTKSDQVLILQHFPRSTSFDELKAQNDIVKKCKRYCNQKVCKLIFYKFSVRLFDKIFFAPILIEFYQNVTNKIFKRNSSKLRRSSKSISIA